MYITYNILTCVKFTLKRNTALCEETSLTFSLSATKNHFSAVVLNLFW